MGNFFSRLQEALPISLIRKEAKALLIGTVLPVAIITGSFLLPNSWSWENPRFDSILDGIASCVCFSLASLLLLLQQSKRRESSFFLSIALFAMGALHLMRSATEQLRAILWLHRMELLLGGLFFLAAWIPRSRPSPPLFRWKYLLAFLAPTFAVSAFVVFAPESLPPMVVDGKFTNISHAFCVTSGLIFITAGFLRLLSPATVGEEDVVLLNLCFYFGLTGLTHPMTVLWSACWWTVRCAQLIPYGLAFGYVFKVIQETQDALVRTTDALRRSNEELENFAYVAAHDLKEPARTISSFLTLLGRNHQEKLDTEAREYIQFATDAASRMSRLISDLLEFSRFDHDSENLGLVDCNKAVKSATRGLEVAIQESHAAVTWDPLPTVPARVTEIEQLLQNLIGNAIKYAGNQPPKIHIRGERDPKSRSWLFSITDNGIGFEMKDATRIFLIFQRLHGMAERPGSGIGLATCKKIVERYGGKIWATSTPGHGSVFYFTIPDVERGQSTIGTKRSRSQNSTATFWYQ